MQKYQKSYAWVYERGSQFTFYTGVTKHEDVNERFKICAWNSGSSSWGKNDPWRFDAMKGRWQKWSKCALYKNEIDLISDESIHPKNKFGIEDKTWEKYVEQMNINAIKKVTHDLAEDGNKVYYLNERASVQAKDMEEFFDFIIEHNNMKKYNVELYNVIVNYVENTEEVKQKIQQDLINSQIKAKQKELAALKSALTAA